jgi:hypothetical protein
MAAVKRYRFRALVTLGPAASAGPARRIPSRMRVLTAHACCLVQPAYHCEYFPAVISRDAELPLARHAMMTIALTDGEAEALFAPGQRFTIWDDGMVGRTIRAEGLFGYGVIFSPASQPPGGLADDRLRRATAGPDGRHGRLTADAHAAVDGPAA